MFHSSSLFGLRANKSNAKIIPLAFFKFHLLWFLKPRKLDAWLPGNVVLVPVETTQGLLGFSVSMDLIEAAFLHTSDSLFPSIFLLYETPRQMKLVLQWRGTEGRQENALSSRSPGDSWEMNNSLLQKLLLIFYFLTAGKQRKITKLNKKFICHLLKVVTPSPI